MRQLEDVYFGAKFEQLTIHIRKEPRDREQIMGVRKSFLKFYQELCMQIKKRVGHKNELFEMLSWVDLETALSGKVNSLVPLYDKFSVPLKKIDVEQLNNEWQNFGRENNVLENYNSEEL